MNQPEPTKREMIRACLKARGRYDENTYLGKFNFLGRGTVRLCLLFKTIISILIRPLNSFDFLDDGWEMGYVNCIQRNHYFDPEEYGCDSIYVYRGFRHWVVGIGDW